MEVIELSESLPSFGNCDSVQGILGLASPWTTEPPLRHDMFSFYARSSADDSSRLVLGGVDQQYYQGCTSWHNVQDVDQDEEDAWQIHMEGVSLGREDLPQEGSQVAILDASTYALGVPWPVFQRLITALEMICVTEDADNIPTPMDECPSDLTAWQEVNPRLVVDCEKEFVGSLEFLVGIETYTLKQEDLVVSQVTPHLPICIVEMQPNKAWVLGGVFLNKYHSVWDWSGRRIGLAVASKNPNHEICVEDWMYDVRYNGTALYVPTLAPIVHTHAPHPAPAMAPVPKAPTLPGSGSDDTNSSATFVSIAVVLFCFAMCWHWQRRPSRPEYRRASHYMDDGDFAGDMELT